MLAVTGSHYTALVETRRAIGVHYKLFFVCAPAIWPRTGHEVWMTLVSIGHLTIQISSRKLRPHLLPMDV